MKLMMLGASHGQLQGILTAKAMGHTLITCDYYPHAIGHGYSDHQIYVSTFDLAGVLKAAQQLQIDGIITMGTDQPVYTAACVAHSLGLPSLLSPETALKVTNKKEMKRIFESSGLPSVQSILYKKSHNDEELSKLIYPVVIKPLDSQGQRGVYYVESKEAVMDKFESVIAHSRLDEILVEVYYPHEELTVSGWVENGRATILTVTDRVTFSAPQHLGICLSHEYPSRHIKKVAFEVNHLTQQLVESFQIKEGPIYFQYLYGEEGLKVNEVACRIGGAYEGVFIPRVTGVDLCQRLINAALGIANGPLELNSAKENESAVSVQLFFAKPCILGQVTEMEAVLKLEGVVEGAYTGKMGRVLGPIENATSRVGYVIVEASDPVQLEQRLINLYQSLRLEDAEGKSVIVHRPLDRGGYYV